MSKRSVETKSAPRPGGAYSQGIVAGGFLFTAGMGPHDPTTGEIVGETIEEQTARTLQNLKGVLEAEGLDYDDVVKVTCHLARLERDFAGYDSAYRRFFNEPFPVRTTVGSQLSGMLIEVDVVALERGAQPSTPGALSA